MNITNCHPKPNFPPTISSPITQWKQHISKNKKKILKIALPIIFLLGMWSLWIVTESKLERVLRYDFDKLTKMTADEYIQIEKSKNKSHLTQLTIVLVLYPIGSTLFKLIKNAWDRKNI